VKTYKFDPDGITIADMRAFRQLTGKGLVDALSTIQTKGAASLNEEEMAGIYYVVVRQNDPSLTVDALGAVTFREIGELADALDALLHSKTAGSAS
jgi:hypothetical protein